MPWCPESRHISTQLLKTIKFSRRMAGPTLPERVAQIYYTYGLFCSSYPAVALTLALSAVLLCCYPLLNVPLPGNIPTVVNVPLDVNRAQLYTRTDCRGNSCRQTEPPVQMDLYFNETQKLPYVWAKDKPLLYVQQIIMKIGVSPWTNNLKLWDAFRAPLQEVFRLLETVRNHEDPETKTTLLHHCYQIEAIKRRDSRASLERVLPEYGCLLLSPANLWQQNLQAFSLDANIISTVYNYQNLQKGKVSVAEMSFGLPLRDTGVKRYPLRARPRVLQYALTVFYRHADQRFIQSLTKKLQEMYPLYQDKPQPHAHADEVTLIYYPGQFNYHELIPLLITFVGIFLYVYFSVRKIEFIKSKFGLAACSVLTIAGSLSMSMGICFYFGFTLSLQGKEIFPYLVIIVGLENVLVLTKSVTSTDSRLDVKIRLAQGLSKEGWSITKNLLTEITIFTVSFFTFVPFIQEFSIFMIVSLLSDYFSQMVFFATILGIDVRRMELFQEQNTKLHLKEYFNANSALNWRYNRGYLDENNVSPQRMTKSKSHPRLNGLAHNSPTDVVAKRNGSAGGPDRVPKRIRLVNLWARTRFFQRAFMLWMLVWISMIVYNSGVVEYFITNGEKADTNVESTRKNTDRNGSKQSAYTFYNSSEKNHLVFPPLLDMRGTERTAVDANDTIFLKHSLHSRPWTRVPAHQWSAILSQYNESAAGRWVALLPPVLLSQRVAPELAAGLRNPDEREPLLRWQALAAALDPADTVPDFELVEAKGPSHPWGKATELPIYPTTPMEILLLAILCTISVAVIAYMMVVLYRCICSRHYAEWRASWNNDEEYRKIIAKQPAVQLVMEAVPLVVAGHSQEVECLVTDGEKVVSSCLQGNVKVWDSQNGDVITNIDRTAFYKLQKELYEKFNQRDALSSDDTEVCPAPELIVKPREAVPQLRKGLSNHLSGLRFRTAARHAPHAPTHLSTAEITKYNFSKNYRELYCTDENDHFHNPYEAKENVDSSNFIGACRVDVNTSYRDSEVCDTNGSVNMSDVNNICDHKSELSNDSIRSRNCDTDNVTNLNWNGKVTRESPVWCMDFCNDLIILGCADGRLEFWEATSGKLMCMWRGAAGGAGCERGGDGREESAGPGVTHARALSGGRRACAASLAGQLTLVRLDAYNAASGAHVDWRFSTAHRRTHKRTGSAGSLHSRSAQAPSEDTRARMSFPYEPDLSDNEELVCSRIAQCRPHQQPITEMHCEGGRVLTGSQDHVLKVFSSGDLSPLFTLHGHCGPITSCFIDHANPTIAGSGSQDGLLCVWDLHTGACLYSMQAHDGAVTSLAYTASYVVSAGADERLCIWDRFQGHMLNSLHIGLNYMSRMLPLTHTLLVMGDRSGLTVYDLSSGDVIRRVLLGQTDGCIFIRQILPLKDAIVCDYANQLRIVRFPLVSRLYDLKSE